MKVCYIVYREDNVMVFESQVLEYLKKMRYKVEHVELIVFRHERNMFQKKKLENRILEYVDECATFASLPVVSTFQIKLDAVRLRNYVHKKYKDEQVAVICRGDLAAYVGAYAFRQVSRARVLFDNRGLPQEESILSHGNQWIHKRNRGVKAYAMNYAKDHCDAYNFVTTNLREYDIEQYGYHKDLPFSIVPTLYSNEKVDNEGVERIIRDENCEPDDYIVTYIGSTAAWQSTGKLAEIFQRIYNKKSNAKFFVLTNGSIPEIQELQGELKQRIVVKEVPHNDVKYYLRITDAGIVIRDSNIVNRVAAPTKIAEYVTSGVQLLYSGEIGILSDLSKIRNNDNMIEIDTTPNWDELLRKRSSDDDLSAYVDYFDMDKRQLETLKVFRVCFSRGKM